MKTIFLTGQNHWNLINLVLAIFKMNLLTKLSIVLSRIKTFISRTEITEHSDLNNENIKAKLLEIKSK